MKNNKYKVIGTIVTYNPIINRLEQNIESVIKQVDELIVVDNGSENIEDIISLNENKRFTLIRNEKNVGLAEALNQACAKANEKDAEWCVTLDQDTVIPKHYIDNAKRYFEMDEVGAITCGYFEENLGREISKYDNSDKYIFVNRCITSACVLRMKAYNQIRGGYDQDLFVDYVDFDFSIKLRKKGYKILFMNDVVIAHELGDSRNVRFLFWNVRYTSHSAIREYYIARNITIFIGRYKGSERIIRDFLSLIKHYVLIAIYDENKSEKIKALNNGRKDGKRYLIENRRVI